MNKRRSAEARPLRGFLSLSVLSSLVLLLKFFDPSPSAKKKIKGTRCEKKISKTGRIEGSMQNIAVCVRGSIQSSAGRTGPEDLSVGL